MALTKYATKDEIPEAEQADAIELKDGSFAVDTADDAADALKSALDDERTKRVAAEKNATKAANELKKLELKGRADKAGITDEQIQQIRAEVRTEVEAEILDKYKDYEAVKKDNRTLRLDNQVKKLLGDAKFKGERHDSLWKIHGDEFDLTDDGKPMVKGRPGVAVDKYIKDVLVKAYPEWVEGTKASGGGAAGMTTNGFTPTTASADDVLQNPGAVLAASRAAGKTE